MTRFGIEFTFTRLENEKSIQDSINPHTKMIWVETPSNPLLNITDLELVSSVAQENEILTVADNTFSSTYFVKPLDFGINLVVHSTTKYLNGHSDVIGGATVTSTPPPN
ncbi:MAG: aminotransferase class I/II-fold pyridoxal phosphate-dependent enzyme [Methanobacteriaceae archaeon]|nr:aminotransferase class I/II-fold pyridoxal phosphate-dependent enzyme [Methanobacteriaceae archaeon]